MRILVAIDIDDAWRENADLTLDEIEGQVAEDLAGIGRVVASAEVTESYDAILDALEVGADGLTNARVAEEVWVAGQRLGHARMTPPKATREVVTTYGNVVLGDEVEHRVFGHGEVTHIDDQGEGWRLFHIHNKGTTYATSEHNDTTVKAVVEGA